MRYICGVLCNPTPALRDEFMMREWVEVSDWWLVPKPSDRPFVDFGDLFALSECGKKRIVLSRNGIRDFP
jgi:hypothetical protein